MSVKPQQLIRPHFFWALVICLVLSSFSIAHAAQQITLAWDGNTPSPEGYRVYQRVAGQSYTYASPVWPKTGDDPSATSCTLGDLADDTSYYFVVRAYVGADESGDSNEVHHSTATGTLVEHAATQRTLLGQRCLGGCFGGEFHEPANLAKTMGIEGTCRQKPVT